MNKVKSLRSTTFLLKLFRPLLICSAFRFFSIIMSGERADAPYKGAKDYMKSFRQELEVDGRYYRTYTRKFTVKNTMSRFGLNEIILDRTKAVETYDIQNLFLTLIVTLRVKQEITGGVVTKE